MSEYIYFVGKPYPYIEAINIIKARGYKAGLFLDRNVKLKHPQRYDKVIEIDFSTPNKAVEEAAKHNLGVAGLICTYENYIVAKAQLAKFFGVPSISPVSAMASTDKLLMRQSFLDTNPKITPGFGQVLTDPEALEVAEKYGYPLILKPTNLVKSLLVLRCNNETELLKNIDYARENIVQLYSKQRVYDRQPRFILEKYISGKTCSVAAFIDKNSGVHFCDGVAALVNAQDLGLSDNYLYSRSLPGNFTDKLRQQMFEVANDGIRALKMSSTPAHIELVYNEEGVKIIEIGARIGGYRPRMYELSYGLNLIDQEIQLALGETPDVNANFQAYSCVYELFPKTEGEFINIEAPVDTSNFVYFSVKARPGQTIGPAKMGYKAAAVIIISHPDQTQFTQLQEAVNQLRVKIK